MDTLETQPKESTFVSEIDELLSTYNNVHSEELAQQLIPLIKRAFGTIFLMEYHHTFEELVQSIQRFDVCCMDIRKKIESLNQKEVELIAEKGKKSTENIEMIKTIQQQVRSNKQRYASCRRISELLENEKVRATVVSFCQKLSHLQYSGAKMERDECSKLLFHFLWIVNHFTFDFEDEPNKVSGTVGKIFGKKKKNYDTHSVEELMDEVRSHLDANEIDEATHAYTELLIKYKELSQEQMAEYYGEIFIMWFEMHFYEHRSPGAPVNG